MSIREQKIAIVGGTGGLGGALAERLARHGISVIIGSRDPSKAETAARALLDRIPNARIAAMSNEAAARAGDVIAVTVPYSSHTETLQGIAGALSGKILIDATVCLNPPKVGTVAIPAEGSACVQAQRMLGDKVRVVAAFQNISAAHLGGEEDLNCDVLVCADDPEALRSVADLVETIGLKAWEAGPIANAVGVEAMTSILISINRRHKIKGAGVRIMAAHG